MQYTNNTQIVSKTVAILKSHKYIPRGTVLTHIHPTLYFSIYY